MLTVGELLLRIVASVVVLTGNALGASQRLQEASATFFISLASSPAEKL